MSGTCKRFFYCVQVTGFQDEQVYNRDKKNYSWYDAYPNTMNSVQTDAQSLTDLVLHGHFYQPPRENPRTDIIEIQETAAPFDDWNENIWASCYRANAHSRYLSSTQIESISNNYSYLSFNFGPTLLSWMAEKHPHTMEMIVEADKASVRRLGHGNAIAQGFNHTILPLDKPEDARIEVQWGLESFRNWFGRDSEGFWCPEAAINPTIIDILAQCGVKFVILSPWQCGSIEDQSGKLIDLKGKPAPYDTPFVLTGEKGNTLSAFFYHPGLASGISFGHLLRDADNLYRELLSIKESDHPALIHTATDGEIYGHHEPYGDMALCALIKKVNSRKDFTLTNYGTFLERHPAKLHAELLPGEDGQGTSWSCVHGVSRWYKDCGCHTGGEDGWNQKWRTPLRKAFNTVHTKVVVFCDTFLKKTLGPETDTYAVLSCFGPVAAKQVSMQAFLDGLQKTKPFPDSAKPGLARLFECYMFSMYAFTSCGWFFSDLGGIEPRQNISYALMSVFLYQELTGEAVLPSFLIDLQDAKCNRPQDGNGMTIAAQEWMQLSGPTQAALFFHFASRLGDPSIRYGNYQLESKDNGNYQFLDRMLLTRSVALVQDLSTQGKLNLIVTINDVYGAKLSQQTVTGESVPKEMCRHFSKVVSRRLADMKLVDLKTLSEVIDRFGILENNCSYPYDPVTEMQTIGLAFNALASIFATYTSADWDSVKEVFLILVRFVSRAKRTVDKGSLSLLVNKGISLIARNLKEREDKIDDGFAATLYEFLSTVRREGIIPELTQLQEAVYPSLCDPCSPSVRKLGYELNFATVVVRAQD